MRVIHGYFNKERDMEEMLGDNVTEGKTFVRGAATMRSSGECVQICVYSHCTNTGDL